MIMSKITITKGLETLGQAGGRIIKRDNRGSYALELFIVNRTSVKLIT